MNAKAMVYHYLIVHGFDGLCTDDCGCPLTDLAPCGEGPLPDCRAAKSRILGDGEHVGECGPGDILFYEP
jgi:hypothetical protein